MLVPHTKILSHWPDFAKITLSFKLVNLVQIPMLAQNMYYKDRVTTAQVYKIMTCRSSG